MSEDLTKELPMSMEEKIDQLFSMTRNVITGLNQLDARLTALENKEVITKPLWQEMRAEQGQIFSGLQTLTERVEKIEAHLVQQDEKMDDGFRKLNDKFEILSEEWFETRADMKHLKRRVTQIETIN